MARNELLNPANFTKGGFFTPGRYKINLAEFTPNTPKDKDGKAVDTAKCALHINASLLDDKNKPVGDDVTNSVMDRFWNVGELTDFVPADDDLNPTPGQAGPQFTKAEKGTKSGMFEGSGCGIFMTHLTNGGYDNDRLQDHGAYGLNGCIITFKEIPDTRDFTKRDDTPQMAGAAAAKKDAKKNKDIIVPDDVLQVPPKVVAGKPVEVPKRDAKGTTPASTQASGGKANGAAKPTNGSAAASDVDDGDAMAELIGGLSDTLEAQTAKGRSTVLRPVVQAGLQKALNGKPDSMVSAVMSAWKNETTLNAALEALGWKASGTSFEKLAD
jgi:hypothetical protein